MISPFNSESTSRLAAHRRGLALTLALGLWLPCCVLVHTGVDGTAGSRSRAPEASPDTTRARETDELPAAARSPIHDVKRFGARGDGIHDDTASIQAAIDAAGKSGGSVVFPDTDAAYLAAASTLTVERPVRIVFGHGALLLASDAGSTAGLRIGSGSVELIGQGRFTIRAQRDVALPSYNLIEVHDALDKVSEVRLAGLEIRLEMIGSTSQQRFNSAVRFNSTTPGHGLSDLTVADCRVSVDAPDLGTSRKWYGLYFYDFLGPDNPSRSMERVTIVRNTLDSCDGRNIQVFMGSDVLVARNTIVNLSPGNRFGANGIRLLGTTDGLVADNSIEVGPTGHGNCIYIGSGSGYLKHRSKASGQRLRIVDNTCERSPGDEGRGSGIYVAGVSDVLIADNTLRAARPARHTYGIWLRQTEGYANVDVTISANIFEGDWYFPVRVDKQSMRTRITDNHFRRTGSDARRVIQDLADDTLVRGSSSGRSRRKR